MSCYPARAGPGNNPNFAASVASRTGDADTKRQTDRKKQATMRKETSLERRTSAGKQAAIGTPTNADRPTIAGNRTGTGKRGGMRRHAPFLLALVLCFGAGLCARLFQADSIGTWYPALAKPRVTPPDAAFPVAWAVIYLCTALSVARMWRTGEGGARRTATLLFALQLALNVLWNVGFFFCRSPLAGLLCIAALDAVVLWYALLVRRLSALSAWLCAPYLLWLALATYLNGYILIHN